MFYLHLFPPTSREKYLMNTLAVVCVHDGDGSPISTHPEGVSPDGKAGNCEESAVIRYGDLHLGREEGRNEERKGVCVYMYVCCVCVCVCGCISAQHTCTLHVRVRVSGSKASSVPLTSRDQTRFCPL